MHYFAIFICFFHEMLLLDVYKFISATSGMLLRSTYGLLNKFKLNSQSEMKKECIA